MDTLDRLAHAQATLTAPGAPFELTEISTTDVAYNIYKNAPETLIEVIKAARKEDDSCFLTYLDDHWSFQRFYQTVDSVAGWMYQKGIRPGQRVAIAMRNRPEWAVAFVASALIGAVPAPLNSFGVGEELAAAIDDIKPDLLVCDQERFRRLIGEVGVLGCDVLLTGTPQDGTTSFKAAASEKAIPLPEPSLCADDPALILFTSGATSRAKAVVSSQRAVCQALTNIDYISALSGMTSPELIQKIMARSAPQVLLTAVPLFHVSGLHAQLLTALKAGRRVIFMHKWEAASVLKTMKDEQVTQFNGAPSMVTQLLRQPEFIEASQSLVGLGFGGAGIPATTIEHVLDTLTEQLVGVGYGMTETNGVASAGAGDLFRSNPAASGVVSPIMQVRTCSLEGDILSAGEAGEIQLKGVTVMDCYLDNPRETEAAFTDDGWLKTGDLGYLDSNGYLFIVDRLKDVINRAGENIAATEVESCLLKHDDVLEAAVFGVPDEDTGESVVAVVHVRDVDRVTPVELRKFAASHIAAYKVPSIINLLSDSLPKNPTGKILKAEIKAKYCQSAS
ncbi:class I adenylate-forming enzyme family protein [Endozoicomonas sp.]|uniref:class I adenylate-forming enzyme family protein n=1 Tax=Endozoicomonas sp. TaxID=1892382 RepID=UPI00383ADB9B